MGCGSCAPGRCVWCLVGKQTHADDEACPAFAQHLEKESLRERPIIVPDSALEPVEWDAKMLANDRENRRRERERRIEAEGRCFCVCDCETARDPKGRFCWPCYWPNKKGGEHITRHLDDVQRLRVAAAQTAAASAADNEEETS